MKDKVAIVSGAASGIGRATAQLFARSGARVVVADIDSSGERVAAEIASEGGQALFLSLDVTSDASWRRAIEQTTRTFQRLDVLVNNAGVSFVRAIGEMTLEEWRQVMAVNLDGVFLGTKHAIVAMRAGGRGGSIVNMSSASGLVGSPTASAYCASKGGVRLFTKAIALECAADRIQINSIHPGAVRTPIWEKAEWWAGFEAQAGGKEAAFKTFESATPMRRMAAAEEVAQAILFLASDSSAFITGAELIIDGGYTAQ